MYGKVRNLLQLERVVWGQHDSVLAARFAGWEARFNDDKICLSIFKLGAFGTDRPLRQRTGDRAWVGFKVFDRVVSIDVARPGSQRPVVSHELPTLTDLESSTNFAIEALEELRASLERFCEEDDVDAKLLEQARKVADA